MRRLAAAIDSGRISRALPLARREHTTDVSPDIAAHCIAWPCVAFPLRASEFASAFVRVPSELGTANMTSDAAKGSRPMERVRLEFFASKLKVSHHTILSLVVILIDTVSVNAVRL